MIATAWNNGSHHPTGAGYGIKLDAPDRDRHFKRALAIWQKALGPDHPEVAGSLKILAALYRATKRNDEAQALEKRAARIRAIKR